MWWHRERLGGSMMAGAWRKRVLDLQAWALVWPCSSTDQLAGLGDKLLCLKLRPFCPLWGCWVWSQSPLAITLWFKLAFPMSSQNYPPCNFQLLVFVLTWRTIEVKSYLSLSWHIIKYLKVDTVNPISYPFFKVNISRYHKSFFYDSAFRHAPHSDNPLCDELNFSSLNCGPQHWMLNFGTDLMSMGSIGTVTTTSLILI